RHTRSKRDWSSDVCSSDLGRILTHFRIHSAIRSDGKKIGRTDVKTEIRYRSIQYLTGGESISQLKVFHTEITAILYIVTGRLIFNRRGICIRRHQFPIRILRTPCIQGSYAHRTGKGIEIGELSGQVKEIIPLGSIEK